MGWGCPSVQVSRAQPGLELPSYTRVSLVAWAGGCPVRGCACRSRAVLASAEAQEVLAAPGQGGCGMWIPPWQMDS